MKIGHLQLQDAPEDLTDTPVAALEDGTARHCRPLFDGPIIANGGFDLTSAQALLAAGDADAVAFGAPYLANRDLVERLRDGLPLTPVPPRETWYGGGAKGYTDHPRAGNG